MGAGAGQGAGTAAPSVLAGAPRRCLETPLAPRELCSVSGPLPGCLTAPISCCAWNVTFRGRQVPAWQETTWKTNDRTPAGHKGPRGLQTADPMGVASLLISVGSLRSWPQAPRCLADPPCGVTLRGERFLEPADLGFPASRSRLTRPCMKGPGRRSLPEESVAVTSLSMWPLPRYQSKYTANHETRDPRPGPAASAFLNFHLPL